MATNLRKRKRAVQLDLPFEARAKARRRAGRKPAKGRRNMRHRARPVHVSSHPLHVVLRSKFRPLRSRFVFPTLRKALAKAARVRSDFRVVQFSVQSDHLHLIVEASDRVTANLEARGAAMQEARFVVDSLANGRKFPHRLMDFNNDPDTGFTGVQQALHLLEERLKNRLATGK